MLDGQIRRGSGEIIRAVIWLCDIRGFTNLSEALPNQDLIELLNCYFGPMCDAVAAHGGEVLKFIGDAMLAIFPIGADPPETCARALIAAGHAERHWPAKTTVAAVSACRASSTAWRCILAT
ncbi:adenylate/guanylate cyclase domain-containing protein [Bradyrhizobium sp.]|uniref:adenylate/guanylate cyclase domain-containing protein n=1 Tax=Bradyrhizobium sp. TaxID=376 RepID=UPI003C4D4DBF